MENYDLEAILDMYDDDYVREPRPMMAGGGEVVIGKPGGLVQPETKFYAIKKTIKGTGDNAGNITTYVGPRDNQTKYIGSQEYINKIRRDNPKFGKTGPTVHEQRANKAAINKQAIKIILIIIISISVPHNKCFLLTCPSRPYSPRSCCPGPVPGTFALQA